MSEGNVLRVALVTGGSRGIGAATAIRIAADGYAVAINYLNDATAAQSVAHTINRAGGEAFCIQADVAVEEDITRLFGAIDGRWGRLDALVNNAGIAGERAAVGDLSTSELRRIIDVNLIGSMLCCREAVHRMSTRGGAIVNLSSAAALTGGGAGIAPYAAAKSAVEAFTIGFAREVGKFGIRVNTVRPGAIDTDMNSFGTNVEQRERFEQTTPLGRVGRADEVAAAIAWLLSTEASYISGAILPITGGR